MARVRDIEVGEAQEDLRWIYEKYGKEDFMTERDKLNISFHNNTEIEAVQLIK